MRSAASPQTTSQIPHRVQRGECEGTCTKCTDSYSVCIWLSMLMFSPNSSISIWGPVKIGCLCSIQQLVNGSAQSRSRPHSCHKVFSCQGVRRPESRSLRYRFCLHVFAPLHVIKLGVYDPGKATMPEPKRMLLGPFSKHRWTNLRFHLAHEKLRPICNSWRHLLLS